MNSHFVGKRFLYSIFIVILVASSFIFRNKISKLLSFKGNIKVETPFFNMPTTQDTKKTETAVNSKSPAVFNYVGRDPVEIRPDPEEVKLFSEDQKKDLYAKIKLYGNNVKEHPDSFSDWLQLGLFKKVIGDYEGARDAWEYAGMVRPLNSVSFANLGELYWKYLYDYPGAEKNFRISIKNKPEDPSVYVSLADLYYYSYKEKSNLAEGALLEGLTNNPKDVNLMRVLASFYQRAGQYSKAIEWWQKVLKEQPNDTVVAGVIEGLKKQSVR